MAASDHNGPQFDFVYDTVDTGGRRPLHRIQAVADGNPVGGMVWSSKEVQNIDVKPPYQRQGLATRMWQEGHRVASENVRVPAPKHSADRTDAGDAWARKVGGRLPRRRQSLD